jgi:hypothetical protein
MRPVDGKGANGLYRNPSPLAGKDGDPDVAPATFKLEKIDDNARAAKKRDKQHPKKDAHEAKPPPKAANPAKDAKEAADAGEQKDAADGLVAPAKPAGPAKTRAHPAGAHDANAGGHDAKASGEGVPSVGGHGEASVGGRGGRGGHSGTSTHGSSRGTGPGAAHSELTSQTMKTAPGDAARDRTTVAVGEEVDFTSTSAGSWSASASTGTASGTGDSFHWKAQDAAGTATITFTPTGGGAAQTKQMHVVAPTSIDFRKMRDEPQPPAGAGMWTNLTFGPQTVNFYNVEWLEVPGFAESVTGYFDQLQMQEGRELEHNPNANWTPMSEDGAVNNDVDDHAFINTLPRLTRTVIDFFGERRYFAGSFQWNVPNKYRVAGQGDGQVFQNVVQSFTMDDAGTVTVSKGGQSATQASDGVAAAEGLELPRFDTVAAASAALRRDGGGSASAQLISGLTKLSTYRTRDHDSYNNLIAALNLLGNVKLYVAVRCTNTYSIFTEDSVTLNVTGTNCWSTNFSVNTNRFRDFNVPWTSVINPASFNSTTGLHFHIDAEGHEFSASMVLPFNDYGTRQTLSGSDDRYQLTSFFKVV